MLRPVLTWRGYGDKGRCVKYIHMYVCVHTGCIWATGFHHVTACSFLACSLKLMNHLFLQFSNSFSGRGYGGLTVFLNFSLLNHYVLLQNTVNAKIMPQIKP
jgi:hypothetical protein